MPASHTFVWEPTIALVGPATVPVSIGGGTASGGIVFQSGATSTHTRELIVCGSAGNIKCRFLNQTTTSVTIPVIANFRYPWAVTHVFSSGTTASGIWGFY